MKMMKAFVCGQAVSHSRSPLIHRYWFRRYGLKGRYDMIDIEPENLGQVFCLLREGVFAGGNFTAPYKEKAFHMVDCLDNKARMAGAVNTIYCKEGTLWGFNTDADGFVASLNESFPPWRQCTRAVVLGAGGAARGVVLALKLAKIKNIHVINRTLERACALVIHFRQGVTAHGIEQLEALFPQADLIINATTTLPGALKDLIDSLHFLKKCFFIDLAYLPLETGFLKIAQGRGIQGINGTGMLLHQAAQAFECWFGIRPDVTTELRELLLRDLEAESPEKRC